MTAPLPRRRKCPAVASNGDPCTRTDLHGLDDLHGNGGHTWGFRPEPQSWVQLANAGRLPPWIEGGTAR